MLRTPDGSHAATPQLALQAVFSRKYLTGLPDRHRTSQDTSGQAGVDRTVKRCPASCASTASRTAAAVFAFSLFLGSLMVQIVFAAGGATLSRLVSRPGWIRALNMLSGAAIAAFGVTALIRHAA